MQEFYSNYLNTKKNNERRARLLRSQLQQRTSSVPSLEELGLRKKVNEKQEKFDPSELNYLAQPSEMLKSMNPLTHPPEKIVSSRATKRFLRFEEFDLGEEMEIAFMQSGHRASEQFQKFISAQKEKIQRKSMNERVFSITSMAGFKPLERGKLSAQEVREQVKKLPLKDQLSRRKVLKATNTYLEQVSFTDRMQKECETQKVSCLLLQRFLDKVRHKQALEKFAHAKSRSKLGSIDEL